MAEEKVMVKISDLIHIPVEPKGLMVVLGEPGAGKTTFCLQYMADVQEQDVTGLFISLKRFEDRFIDLFSNLNSALKHEIIEFGKKTSPEDLIRLIKRNKADYTIIDDFHLVGQTWNTEQLSNFLIFLSKWEKGILITSISSNMNHRISEVGISLADLSHVFIELRQVEVQQHPHIQAWIHKHPILGDPHCIYCYWTQEGLQSQKESITQSTASLNISGKLSTYRASSGQVSLVLPEILYFSPLHQQRVQKRIELYNRQHTNYPVRLPDKPIVSILEYHQLTQQFEEGKSPFACFPVDLYRLPELVEKELIYPIDDYFPEAAQQAYLDKAIQQCRYRGKVYAIPQIINVGVMAYRQDLLDRIHRNPPETWKELADITKVILRDQGDPKLQGIGFQGAQFENLTCNLLELIWCNGGEVFDSAGHIIINRPEAVEALQFMQDLIHKYKYSPDQTPFMMESHCERLFLQGKMIFMRSWPRIVSQAELPNSHVSGRVGIVPLPVGPSGRESVPVVGAFGYVIPRTVPDPEPVWQFLTSLMSPDAALESATIGWSCPVLKEMYMNPDVLRARPYYRQMIQLIPKGRLRQSIPNYPVLTNLIKREAHLAIRNEKPAQDALDIIARELHKSVHRQLHMAPIQQAMDYVNGHLKDPLTRDQVARIVGISPSHFSVLFKDVTGQTFTDFLMHARIEEARRLLGRTEMNISQISHEVGFNDESYFSYTFKRLTGVTPSHYRLNLQGTILSL